jgi:uncharacterized MAPEG superfamily protein
MAQLAGISASRPRGGSLASPSAPRGRVSRQQAQIEPHYALGGDCAANALEGATMSPLTEAPAAQPLILFSVLLVLKMGAVGFITANQRRKAGVVVNPEDTRVNPGSRAEAQEAPATLRAKRAHLNDGENIPLFLVLATLFTWSGGSAAEGWAYFGSYFAARLLHTIFYLKAVQPWRTVAFFVAQLAQLGIMVQLLIKVF